MKALLVVVLIFVFAYLVGSFLKPPTEIPVNVVESDCDILSQSCSVKHGTNTYKLSFRGIPSALHPFHVELSYNEQPPEAAWVEFDMEGMDMGYNRYTLVLREDEKHLSAQVVLPVCSLSRNDWIVNVKMDEQGDVQQTRLRFKLPER